MSKFSSFPCPNHNSLFLYHLLSYYFPFFTSGTFFSKNPFLQGVQVDVLTNKIKGGQGNLLKLIEYSVFSIEYSVFITHNS